MQISGDTALTDRSLYKSIILLCCVENHKKLRNIRTVNITKLPMSHASVGGVIKRACHAGEDLNIGARRYKLSIA